MTAVKLLTLQFDENIVYRQKLKTGGGLLSTPEGLILAIAAPCAIGT